MLLVFVFVKIMIDKGHTGGCRPRGKPYCLHFLCILFAFSLHDSCFFAGLDIVMFVFRHWTSVLHPDIVRSFCIQTLYERVVSLLFIAVHRGAQHTACYTGQPPHQTMPHNSSCRQTAYLRSNTESFCLLCASAAALPL